MGHWDIINNLDLTNSGSVIVNGKFKACIVDWGNCPQGFGGLPQDACAFQNPEFKALNLKTGQNPVTGFVGCVPFDGIVYPQLPRQVVTDLFDLTKKDSPHREMLAGFISAHEEVKNNFTVELVKSAINEVFSSKEAASFKSSINQELYGETNGLGRIISKRLKSLDEIIHQIQQGETLSDISVEQFKKILHSQKI